MAILVDETTRVLVQGITGREGRARARLMREYGTRLVAGCTPGRGGETVDGVPVFDTVAEATEAAGPFDASWTGSRYAVATTATDSTCTATTRIPAPVRTTGGTAVRARTTSREPDATAPNWRTCGRGRGGRRPNWRRTWPNGAKKSHSVPAADSCG